ncbi:MAG: GNAT family N-acetyltransferase [Chthoniobacterales bacterium]
MIFREIVFDSDEYARECALRDEVLRVPLGMALEREDLETEKAELHFGLFRHDGVLLACAVASPTSPGVARIRQVAVSPHHQNLGLGRKLMHGLENDLHARGFHQLTLHARTTVAGFYEKLGYVRIGGEFIEISIPHVEMEKRIVRPSANPLRATAG